MRKWQGLWTASGVIVIHLFNTSCFFTSPSRYEFLFLFYSEMKFIFRYFFPLIVYYTFLSIDLFHLILHHAAIFSFVHVTRFTRNPTRIRIWILGTTIQTEVKIVTRLTNTRNTVASGVCSYFPSLFRQHPCKAGRRRQTNIPTSASCRFLFALRPGGSAPWRRGNTQRLKADCSRF